MPLQATSGAASYDAFGGGVPVVPVYVEDVMSTYLYTGNGSTQTITNGIDLAGKGGLVWLKNRTGGSGPHNWYTTDIGSASYLDSSQTSGLVTYQEALSTYNSNGFSLSSGAAGGNENTFTYASWTFRKQPKFFDVVTFSTTTGSSVPITVNHNLGSVPGCIIVKQTNGAADWFVYHRSLGSSQYLALNSTDQSQNGSTSKWYSTPTSTSFTLGGDFVQNATYVAYLFAHDAGGFGLTGTDNVISCGSYTGVGGGNVATITLGYEPQWILVKRADNSAGGNWAIFDNMRGMSVNSTDNASMLNPNLSDAESVLSAFKPTATGFQTGDNFTASGGTYIYIAIRRGPMKVPTSGTSVYNGITRTGTGAVATVSGVGFAPDLGISYDRTGTSAWTDKLRGVVPYIFSASTAAEVTNITDQVTSFTMDGVVLGADVNQGRWNYSGQNYINWFFRRAPSFFDEVCYTGTEVSGQTFNHNLGAVPEMMIVKSRSGTTDWTVYHSALGASARIYLNATNAANTGTAAPWNSTTPTSSVFSLGNAGATNLSGATFVNYLFATCAGVSKVGSYTGNGSSQTINCGFTGGARFVLIKKSSGTGDWMVSDSARGIVSGNDPYLELNNTNAEVTGEDWLDTDSTGFVVNEVSGSNANTNGATYIFLAIA